MSKLDTDIAVMVGQYRQWVNKLLSHPDACEWVLQHERIHNRRPEQVRIDSVRIEDGQFVVSTFNLGLFNTVESMNALVTATEQSGEQIVPFPKMPAPDFSHEYVVDPLQLAVAAIQAHEAELEARAL